MKRSRLHLSFVVLLIREVLVALQPVTAAVDLIGHVNTLIGTSYYVNQFDVHDYGNTAPFAGPPFAHTPWTAQTRDSEDKCKSAYYYFDEHWQGMRRSHWMSGSCTIDYGSATIIPSLSNNLKEALTFHKMDHSAETSTPAYYRMNLAESSMIIEAASDLRSGILKVTPSEKDEFFYLIFKASDTMYNQSSVSIVSTPSADNSSGSNEHVDALTITSPVHRWYQSKGQYAKFSGHHYFKTSRPACEFGIIKGYSDVQIGSLSGVSDASGTVAAYLKFESRLGEVRVATGTSFLSVEKARENLYAELETPPSRGADTPGLSVALNQEGLTADRRTFESSSTIFDIERLVKKVSKMWEKRLGAIRVTPFADGSTESVSKDMRGPRTGGQSLSGNSSTDQLVTFYTALWHTQLLPRIVSDYDGQYLSFGDKERTVEQTDPARGFSNYFDDFSMWDIFRAQIPLFNLIYTDITRDMVTSLIRKAEQGGWLPIFPAWHSYTDEMIGDHCAVLIADSFLKGVLSPTQSDNLFIESYKYLVKNAMSVPSEREYLMGMGRRALKSYMQYGFIPLEDEVLDSPHPRQQVSRTLEYSYDDYVVSQMATLYSDSLLREAHTVDGNLNEGNISFLVKAEESRGVAVHLADRSQSYRWVVDGDTSHEWYKGKAYYNSTEKFHKSVNFVRGRHANLSWTETFDSFDPSVYYKWLTETNVWQYSFSVLHDVEGLIQIYGGGEKFIEKLDKLFDDSWYNHGNEPDHHALYLYAYVPGSAWRIQDRLPDIVQTQYGPLERSMSGNDDAGQMSAWLVLSSLGFYQVCPGCGGRSEYVFGLPLFAHVEVTLPSPSQISVDCVRSSLGYCSAEYTVERTLVVNTVRLNNAKSDKYVQLVTWNGCAYDCAFFPHAMIAAGGTLVAYLGPDPKKSWGGDGRKCMDAYYYPGDKDNTTDVTQTKTKIALC